MRRPHRTIALLAMAACAVAATPAAAAGINPSTAFTPVVSSFLTRPTPIKAVDGRFHIAYELVLTNTAAFDVTLRRVDVRDARSGRTLKTLSGGALAANMNPLSGATASASDVTLGPSQAAVVWLDVTVRRRSAVPHRLSHRLTLSGSPGGRPFTLVSSVASVAMARRGPVAVDPPVRPGIWVADEGCCSDPTHHRRGIVGIDGRLMVPQRFAIDWFLLDSRHRAWAGDPKRLTSYFSYGQPELAVAAGTVVDRQDGLPDHKPQGTLPVLPPIRDTVGNHVTLRIAPGATCSTAT